MTFYQNAAATGLAFRKSSFSGGQTGNCVECAFGSPEEVAVRDSKNPTGPAHRYSAAAFARFTAAISTGSLVPVRG